MTDWPKNIIYWKDARGIHNLSVPFTWLLPEAKRYADGLANRGYKVRVGGPAVALMPEVMAPHDGSFPTPENSSPEALTRTNPQATRTTRGCPNRCRFCGVSKIFPAYEELRDWLARPIVIDDNFLACSERHFNRTIDRLKEIPGQIDFSQGLDARLLTPARADRLLELNLMCRFAWDSAKMEKPVIRGIELLRSKGLAKRRISVYVLINFKETPAEALYRMETLKALGLKAFAMRYQPLDTLQKNSYVAPGWTNAELFRFLQYWNRQRVYWNIPFSEFDRAAYL